MTCTPGSSAVSRSQPRERYSRTAALSGSSSIWPGSTPRTARNGDLSQGRLNETVATRKRLYEAASRDMMAAIYERTVDRVREGDSAEDMLKAGVMNGLTRTFHDPGKFLYDVHKGLWAHHNKLAPNVV